ncbi:2-C-methyl-D-erythritol 2,4-cyclodiphosphate synthase [Fragilariopsis cylindrus CCMP1102]|uniref:2-C-methyl-D-erythritol 2,4-cyclodiphosphate synthase n=1 Tax=Fragilariopsis cylindrus CCMP1102 TaxID=635003 RepID=A0A1E7G006_9STRA|nr:2-C-methyl-D-erythritol 2,4-cyclodiphosphate synthase [Fragilariopsis cylindrus CCMP1102]|eukprot:OEU23730.1 2-C-methyl-D-erythritol 2,4-cyclodiphosphate synthase [Fragilariopsis cylindrus CCMP1102]
MISIKQQHRQLQPMMMILLSVVVFVIAHCVSPVTSFVSSVTAAAGRGSNSNAKSTTTTTTTSIWESSAATTTNNSDDDLLHPSYEIEPISIRIGHGFDIHRMAPIEEAGQPIIIGGVVIPHTDQKGGIYETQLGVVAHSDGDVIYHSVVDAIFGALTLPDIGQIFQDTDPRWKGCDSSKFMDHAYQIMDDYGYQVGNLDVTLILERPKVASFKPAMKENIVTLLQTTPGRVNIKARTHERLDSVGELRSLSCHVVLTIERKKNE